MSNATNQQVNIIFGKAGSGKSKIVRKLVKDDGAYSFSYNDTIVPGFCDVKQISELYEFLAGKELTDEANAYIRGGNETSTSATAGETVLLQFCYEVCSLLNMEEPFHTIIFDGVPATFDEKIIENIISLICYLKDQGFTVYFVTSKDKRKEKFEEIFGEDLGKILT